MPEYSTSRSANRSAMICGVPMNTFIATMIAITCYLLTVIIMLSVECPFSRDVSYFFFFVLFGLVAVILMLSVNLIYTRFRMNCLTLTASLIYSGTAFLVLFALLNATLAGLCKTAEGRGIFSAGSVANACIWVLAAIGVVFQIVAHYFYG